MDEAVKWLRLGSDLFDSRKIKQIETLPDGDGIIVIWFKLLCVASEINDCGCVYFTPDIPYTDQTLATQFNRPIPLIQLALSTFVGFDMVEIVDNFLYIKNWEQYLYQEETDEVDELIEKNRRLMREKQARYRAKKKLLAAAQNDDDVSTVLSTGQSTILSTGQSTGQKEGVGFPPDRKESNKEKNKPPLPTEKDLFAHFSQNERSEQKNAQSVQAKSQPQKSRSEEENQRNEETFTAFWQSYPRKVGKPVARKSWNRLNPDDELIEKIMASLEKFKESRGWTKDDGEFIPYPATWINQRRWEDEDDDEPEVGSEEWRKREHWLY